MLYTSDERYMENKVYSYVDALSEFNRVLKPKGHIYLTVPFGLLQNIGWMQQFDYEHLQAGIRAFGGAVISQVFYKYDIGGWQVADAKACAACQYYDVHSRNEFDADYAAAARAVACLEMVKL